MFILENVYLVVYVDDVVITNDATIIVQLKQHLFSRLRLSILEAGQRKVSSLNKGSSLEILEETNMTDHRSIDSPTSQNPK